MHEGVCTILGRYETDADQLYVSAQLICALVFAHARLRFAHDDSFCQQAINYRLTV